MSRPVVLIAEKLSPATVDALGPDFEIRHCDGSDRASLLAEIADVDAILVRSATKVDAEALAVARRLQVVARAGVGLDNVDVEVATKSGIMVVNAPTSNIVSAAELTVGLVLAAARSISAAHATLRDGKWKRSSFSGTELLDKTLGVVGLGNVGVLVTQRLAAFGMKVIAHDPYVQAGRAARLGVRLTSLEELLEQSDVITVHLPKTPETIGLIGEKALSLCKPTAILVNAARGGIVDEAALYDALSQGRLGGAGLDVYASEPCTDSPLFGLDSVVATPHLGASTAEAQERAGIAVAESVRLALSGELVPDAVNVQAGTVAEEVRPAIGLTEQLGRVVSGLTAGVPGEIAVEVRGQLAGYDVTVLELAAIKGVFRDTVADDVTYVNAPLLADEHGVRASLVTADDSPDHRSLVTIRGTLADDARVSVSGTFVGTQRKERIVEVDGYEVDLAPNGHLLFVTYEDRPGMVGALGQLLGGAGINIASMQVSRQGICGPALIAMRLDSAVPSDVLDAVAETLAAHRVRAMDL